MFKKKHNIVSVIAIISILCLVIAASLPKSPYGNLQFEGFSEGPGYQPLLQKVDTDAVINGDYYSLGDPCPCLQQYPTADQPGWTGTCASHGGVLILDPFDLDGLTCSNPYCPCNYYVTSTYLEGRFEGFPFPLNNELISLSILGLLYSLHLVRKRFKSNKKLG